MLNVSSFKQPKPMFGFWGEKKAIQQYWWEKQDAHTKHTKKYGDVSLQKHSFSLAVFWHEWKWISITASKWIHLKSKTYRHVVCISNDTYQVAPARPCHLEQNIFILQPHIPQRPNPHFLISTTKSVISFQHHQECSTTVTILKETFHLVWEKQKYGETGMTS